MLAAAATLGFACTQREIVRRPALMHGYRAERALVYAGEGAAYRFERVLVRGDTLTGEYDVEVERATPDGLVYFEREARAVAVALAQVDSIAIVRRDYGKTLLYGAGLAAIAAFVIEVTNTDLPGGRGSDDGPDRPGGTPP